MVFDARSKLVTLGHKSNELPRQPLLSLQISMTGPNVASPAALTASQPHRKFTVDKHTVVIPPQCGLIKVEAHEGSLAPQKAEVTFPGCTTPGAA